MAPRVTWPLLLLGTLLAGSLHAQTPAVDVIYSKQPAFLIPFQTDPGERRIQQVELFVSVDQGKTWQSQGNAVPEPGSTKGSFRFTAARDGLYWFAVRTIDHQGQHYPATLDALRPGLKVCVDTVKPVVVLQPLEPREGSVGVRWEIQDENLDLASLRLEYRLVNGVQWQPLNLDVPQAAGTKSWSPGTNAPLEVQLRVRDRSDNWSEAKTLVSPGAPSTGGVGSVPPPAPPVPNTANVRMVNSKRISLNYEVQNVGKSGISTVELWYTQDGRNWQKYEERTNQQPPFVFDVNDEGRYGFTLLVRSGVGLGRRPPQVGDSPQIWVEVDLTKPVVQVLNVDVGRGAETGNLTIQWRATDKNLGHQPITLSYAEQASGPWTTIAANVENTGRYVWKMPPQGVPYRFLVRVEATDLAGNVGTGDWLKPVLVDLAEPTVTIIGVGTATDK